MRVTAIALALATGVALAAANAPAQDMKAKCNACHDAEKKKIGPAYKELAKKGLKADAVVAMMKEGKGHPKVAGTDAELKAAVDSALAAK